MTLSVLIFIKFDPKKTLLLNGLQQLSTIDGVNELLEVTFFSMNHDFLISVAPKSYENSLSMIVNSFHNQP
jgi:hypothetical protein